MQLRPIIAFSLGAALVAGIGYARTADSGARFAQHLSDESKAALQQAGTPGVTANFTGPGGQPTRHPLLSGGEGLDEGKRALAARTVAAVPGVGGISWADGSANASAGEAVYEPLHCQEDVEGLLRTRSIRFEEASAALLPASNILLDEVATALRPCLGSIIAVNGHTDSAGTEPGNLKLSLDRARTVREALIDRGIPRDGLRARGLGSSEPVKGLSPEDPANRRIEFEVVRMEPVTPTPVDTPGPR